MRIPYLDKFLEIKRNQLVIERNNNILLQKIADSTFQIRNLLAYLVEFDVKSTIRRAKRNNANIKRSSPTICREKRTY